MELRISPEVLLQAGRARSGEDAALVLKRAGLSKAASVIAYAHSRGVSFGEAKLAVHTSRAWSDQRELDEHIQNTLISASR